MRTRNRHISVWMNEPEYRHLRAQAELAGMGDRPVYPQHCFRRPTPPTPARHLYRPTTRAVRHRQQCQPDRILGERTAKRQRSGYSGGRGADPSGVAARQGDAVNGLRQDHPHPATAGSLPLPMPRTSTKPTLPPRFITSAMSGKPRRPMQTSCGLASTARWRPLMQRCRRPTPVGQMRRHSRLPHHPFLRPRRGHTAGGTRGRRGVCPPSAG